MKIKSIPISLNWVSHGVLPGLSAEKAGDRRRSPASIGRHGHGPTVQRLWFQIPHKVRIIPSILGRSPSEGPRVNIQEQGEHEVSDKGGSSYQSILIPSSSPNSPFQSLLGDSPNPNGNCDSAAVHPFFPSNSNLSRFARHC